MQKWSCNQSLGHELKQDILASFTLTYLDDLGNNNVYNQNTMYKVAWDRPQLLSSSSAKINAKF